MKLKLIFAVLVAPALFGQQRTTVALSDGTPDLAISRLYFYDGSNNMEYVCRSPPQQKNYTWAVTPTGAQGTLTSIVVLTNVGTVTTSAAHGLQPGNLVVVAGSTTSALNGTYKVQTVGSTTTFTTRTSGVSNATYSTSLLTLSSNAPRTTAPVWSIEKRTYDGSNNMTRAQFATSLVSGSTASTSYSFICDNRAATGATTEIAYQ